MAYACDLARRCGAHLVGAAPSGISRHLVPSLPPEQDDPTLALHLDMMREQARAALAEFGRLCETGAPPSHEVRLIDDEPGAGLALHARGPTWPFSASPTRRVRPWPIWPPT
ncbi:hypothetical protein LP419_05235 [Massilia sp. H-1]|nr:hypothetical protein LP419_05235 [Massilia sp. H-1]